MNIQLVRIVAAVLDVNNLTLYKEDGSTVIIPQGDPRVRSIIDLATPMLINYGYADVNIGMAEENHFAKFEEKSSGVVKFFKVAKAKLKGLFGSKPEEPAADEPLTPKTIGNVPGPATVHLANASIYDVSEEDEVEAAAEQASQKYPGYSTTVQETKSHVDEIMKHVVPVSAPDYNENTVHKQGDITDEKGNTTSVPTESMHQDTIIAVVDDKIIPGVELIKSQFTNANKVGNTIGMENFMRRIASVIDKRDHSVKDLLKFMERGDLPVADDGSILIYKVLKRAGGSNSGKFVDCHSKKVEQWTGAYVCMDPSLVDHNRRNECSNGLHVARRGYIGSFGGDVCVLAKLAPEDVIAVPAYDANKMRVCGYHIIMELTPNQYSLVKQNKPISVDPAGKVLLANAISGKHARISHEVRITKEMGGGVQVKHLEKGQPVILACGMPAPVQSDLSQEGTIEAKPEASAAPEVKVKPQAEALENPSKETKEALVALLDVVNKVDEAKTSRQAQAKVLYDACTTGGKEALDKLKAFKKASKVSWEKLGLPDLNGSTFSIREAKPTKAAPVKAKAKVKSKTPSKPKVKEKVMVNTEGTVDAHERSNEHPSDLKEAQANAKILETPADVHEVNASTAGSPRERIQKLLAIGLTSVGVAGAILKLKKQSKKSWDTLGVSPEQVEQIIKLSKAA